MKDLFSRTLLNIFVVFFIVSTSYCEAFFNNALNSPTTASTAKSTRTSSTNTELNMSATDKPFAVVVQAEIQPDRMEEFLKLIQTNAENTRKEPGCIRFGKLRSVLSSYLSFDFPFSPAYFSHIALASFASTQINDHRFIHPSLLPSFLTYLLTSIHPSIHPIVTKKRQYVNVNIYIM